LSNFTEAAILKRQEELYNSITRSFKFKNSKLYNSIKSIDDVNALPIFTKEGFSNSPLTNKKDYLSLYNGTSTDILDDSYESFKNFSVNMLSSQRFISNANLPYLSPYSYTKVVDPFRADYEDSL
jgi:hypothetical protein